MYKVLIYFASPRTKWAGKIHDDDVISGYRYRWLFVARWVARSVMSNLNAQRCGYAIFRGSELIESVEQ